MNNIIQTIRHAARAATVLLIALLAAQTAGAQMFMTVSDADELALAFLNTNVSKINVTNDITDVDYLQSLNRDLTINLNGHTISGDELYIDVGPGRSLTINEEGQDGSVGNIISGAANKTAINSVDGTVTLRNVNITTNYYCAIQYGTLNIGNNVSFNGWTQEPFNTQNVNIIEGGNYNYDPGKPFANVVATVTVGGTPHYFENSGAALAYIVSHPDNDHFSLSDDTYTIHTATGWDAFCYLLADNDPGFFNGKTVRLGADIGTADDPVTSMAGASGKEFTGNFDGQGHTLTVGYGTADDPFGEQYAAPFGEQYAAPFCYIEDGCTIKNLHVAGHIYTSAKFAAGLAGSQYGDVSIENCRVSTVIHSSVSGEGTHGGFVAVNNSNSTLTIEGCLFDGRLLGSSTIKCGGFVGWRNGGCEIRNSLFAPTEVTVGTDGSATFARNTVDTYNSYYTYLLNDGTNYAPALADGTVSPAKWHNGKACHSVTAGENVTIDAIALTGDATEYTVSGITAYSGGGLQLGENLYYGSGDAVRLTLSNTATGAPLGYQYAGYTTNAGTLSGSTLTMPDEDVTVSLALRSTGEPVEVSYVDADGNTQPAWAIALDGTESYLDRDDDQETWYFVGLPTVAFDHMLNLNGDVHLILADGCTMNVTSSNVNGIDVNGSLTIYGQTEGTGTLNATGHYDGIYTESGDITISGGRVTATGGEAGIFTYSGTITLGCTTASDFIYASRYLVGDGGRLNIAGGQTLFDEDGNRYRGNGVNIPAGKTLRLSPGIALTARQAPDGNYWTTYYNGTRGFTIDEDENACAYTATYGDGKLTLHNQGKEIPKNTAVIIVAENNVVSMTAATDLDDISDDNDLRGVDDDTQTSTLGTGTFYVLGMTTVKNEQHFGFHRYTGSEMAAHKAYVLVSGSQSARSLTMVFDEASGIESLTPDAAPKAQAAQHWFTLDGRRLQAKPTAPGLYVNNGRKVVIK